MRGYTSLNEKKAWVQMSLFDNIKMILLKGGRR